MDSTTASAKFYSDFQAEKDAIQAELSRSNELDKTHLDQHFEGLLVRINTLERKLTDSTDFIPGYDQRQFSLALRTLKDSLAVSRGNLTPRSKFSFKSRSKKIANSTTNTKQTRPVDANIAASPITSNLIDNNTIKFTGIQNSYLTFAEAREKVVDVSISNLKRCIIRLPENQSEVSAVHIKDVDECVIIADRVSGSILIYGCKRSFIVASCHQFRMHDSDTVKLLLSVTSHPIMEDSQGIVIGAYLLDPRSSVLHSHDNSSEHVGDGRNYYDHMEDFNWLKQQESPNWRLMDTSICDKLNQAISQFDPSKARAAAENLAVNLYEDLFTM